MSEIMHEHTWLAQHDLVVRAVEAHLRKLHTVAESLQPLSVDAADVVRDEIDCLEQWLKTNERKAP